MSTKKELRCQMSVRVGYQPYWRLQDDNRCLKAALWSTKSNITGSLLTLCTRHARMVERRGMKIKLLKP